jgi:hypothetical protein
MNHHPPAILEPRRHKLAAFSVEANEGAGCFGHAVVRPPRKMALHHLAFLTPLSNIQFPFSAIRTHSYLLQEQLPDDGLVVCGLLDMRDVHVKVFFG